MIDELKNDLERIEYLQNLLIDIATGGLRDESGYVELRRYFLSKREKFLLLPKFLVTNRSINQFWGYIKHKFPSYAERREFIYEKFNPLLLKLESNISSPLDAIVSKELNINANFINEEWERALSRKQDDPEGAITLSRTLLESTLKYILDDLDIQYDKNSEFSELYKKVTSELGLSPDEHTEKIFKQILGGCSGIVNGLAALRNKHGDSHGGIKAKPLERHAELAVNLSGTMSMFLFKTYNQK